MISESSSRVELVAIPPSEIEKVWPMAAPLLKKGIDRTRKIDLEDVFLDLELRNSQLWLVWEITEQKALAALVTQICDYPSGFRTVRMYIAGGSRMWRWMHLRARIEEYAVEEGLDGVELVGRRGWGRLFHDYTETDRTYFKGVPDDQRRV